MGAQVTLVGKKMTWKLKQGGSERRKKGLSQEPWEEGAAQLKQ